MYMEGSYKYDNIALNRAFYLYKETNFILNLKLFQEGNKSKFEQC